ncbi:MAG TPA: hypothetical protein VGK32_20195 [Vicinamibacterales bacterium]|jgi:hypothetical protein
MKRTYLLLVAGLVPALAAAACSTQKSSSPLSPSVAGPIAGVSISPPTPVEPKASSSIDVGSQPITLVVANATTNGQRPLEYAFEVASDADFTTKVITREGIAPGSNGQTSFKLPDPLTANRTYYWRSKAEDGANTGPFSVGVPFTVIVPVVLEAPQLVSPINGVTTDLGPTFVVHNSARSGSPVGVSYDFEASKDQAFSQVAGTTNTAEQPGDTRATLSANLAYGTRYYWRARAREMSKSVVGPWSVTQTFVTAVENTPPSGPTTPGDGSGGHIPPGAPTVDRAQAVVYGTAKEFPSLLVVFSTEDQAVSAAEELLLRTIWHLQLAGFQAGRQKNPSGAISKDKLTIMIGGAWHAYDIYSLGYAGKATTVQFIEVTPPNYLPSSGIRD